VQKVLSVPADASARPAEASARLAEAVARLAEASARSADASAVSADGSAEALDVKKGLSGGSALYSALVNRHVGHAARADVLGAGAYEAVVGVLFEDVPRPA
jgi:hypothetical protein